MSRQVAEAINIMYSKDQLLNSKNEYMANCLTRICVEEERFERKKRERKEEEEMERVRLRNFKDKHRRPKRPRTPDGVDPANKRMKTFLQAGKPPGDTDLDLGNWLEKAEARCQRAGDLKKKLMEEKAMVLEKMNANIATSSHEEEKTDAEQIPSSQGEDNQHAGRGTSLPSSLQEHQTVGESKVNLIKDAVSTDFEVGNKASGSGPGVSTPTKKILPPSNHPTLTQDERNKRRERKRKKDRGYLCLTSLPAWWSRVEKEERHFLNEIGKKKIEREKRDREKEKKENFVKKFFPESNSSPGGTFRICRIKSITPAKKRSVGKMLVETEYSDADPVENSSLDMMNFNYSTQKVKMTNTRNRLSCTTELPLDDSQPTNQRRGWRQGNGYT